MSSTANLHPVFKEIFQSIVDAPVLVRRAQYVSALRRHDWSYEYSDDQSVWRAGGVERKRLKAERDVIDLDGALWNANCPPEHRLV